VINFFKMTLVMRLLIVACLLLLFSSCKTNEPGTKAEVVDSSESPGKVVSLELEKPQHTVHSLERMVGLYDSGVNTEKGHILVPARYEIQYSIATNVQSGQYDEYYIELSGPDGIIIRNTGEVNYQRSTGHGFDSVAEYLLSRGIYDLSDLRFGEAQPNYTFMNSRIYQRALPQLQEQGTGIRVIEMPFEGDRAGAPVQGRAEFIHLTYPGFDGSYVGGMVQTRISIAPPERFEEVMEVVSRIDESYEPNPLHAEKVSQIMQARMAQMTREHQQRMAQQQQMFDQHQQKMQQTYASNEQHNRQWREQFNRSWSQSSSSAYSYNDAFRDTIVGQTAFDDPHTGQQIRKDGHYSHWYTDGAGNYHGTNDPSFRPEALGTQWQSIEPLSR